MNSRASVIAPLILILIGGVFLIHNLRPDLSVVHAVAQYWPWVLIGWGGVRLAEILLWHGKGQALPRSGVSGGEWAFVVFLCLLGGSITTAQRFTSWPSGRISNWGWEIMGDHYDFPVAGEAQAAGVTRIVVENLRGNARITGTDETGVKVTGRKSIRSFDRATAEKADKNTPLELQRVGDVLYVRTGQDKWSGDERITAEIDITLPKGVVLECKGRYGDFDVTDLRNSLTITSDNAGVRLQNITGKADINVRRSDIVRAVNVQGDVNLKGSGEDLEFENITGQVTADFSYTGSLEFKNLAKPLRFESNTVTMNMERVPGRIRMSRGEIDAENFVGPARIKSTSKDVRMSEFTGPTVVELDRGDIQMAPGRGPLAQIDARTRSGDIEMALPEKGGFSLNASVDKGSVENDFGSPLKEDSSGRGGKITGTTGTGPTVTLEAGRARSRCGSRAR
jgi:DUF4097 and DUF4098 domain-containing protein YvlB